MKPEAHFEQRKTAIPQESLLTRITNLFQQKRGKNRMQLMESLNLGGKRQLCLVCIDGNEYLVGAGAESVYAIVPLTTGLRHTSLLPGLQLIKERR